LDTAFQNRYGGIEIHAFGSFGSGIYLSTADIDLVLLSDTVRRTGVRSLGERKGHIHAISGFLKSTNIAVPNSIECIAHARVPILKFVDRVTGLRVFAALDHSTGYYAMISLNKWLVIYGLPSELVSPRDTSMGGPDHIACNLDRSVDRQYERKTSELQTNLNPLQVNPAPYHGTNKRRRVSQFQRDE
jgi:hypothetical protein